MDRLFGDWRFALLWVIGISAMTAAYFSDGTVRDQQLAKSPARPAPAAVQLKPGPLAIGPAEDKSPGFGEPVMDTTPFDPNPADPAQSPSAAPKAAAGSVVPAAEEASAPATAAP
jgi:hypothetical protein